jgi:lysozyme
MIYGIDVSFDQGNKVDYKKVVGAGKSFAFAKSSEGTRIKDGFCKKHVCGFQDAGMKYVGIYHYYRPGSDPIQQAHIVMGIAASLNISTIAIDFEITDGLSVGQSFVSVLKCIQEIQTQIKIRPIVYGLNDFWPVWPSAFSEYPFWVENYQPIVNDEIQDPHVVPPWSTWTFHQYAADPLKGIAPGTCDGVEGNVDLDRFNGTEEDLAYVFNITGQET